MIVNSIDRKYTLKMVLYVLLLKQRSCRTVFDYRLSNLRSSYLHSLSVNYIIEKIFLFFIKFDL